MSDSRPLAHQPASLPGHPRIWPRRGLLIFGVLAIATFLLRLPTFFEPAWHADEGTFAAVAQKVLSGGDLYSEAWESKPPLFLYLYAGIFKLFGAGVLPLRIAVAIVALATEFALFLTARRMVGERNGLIAAAALLVLLGVPFWDGNLALTESFSLLPTMLAVYCLLLGVDPPGSRNAAGWLLLSGALFGVAVLIRQPAGAVAIVCVLWLLLSGREWLRPTLLIGAGGTAVVFVSALLFMAFGSFYWFWDANVAFFFSYIPHGREIPFYERPLILAPLIVTIGVLFAYRRRGESPPWSLPALWLVAMLAAALLSGRPYEHYLIPMMPPLTLLLPFILARASTLRLPRLADAPAMGIATAVLLLWFGVVVPAFSGNVFAVRYSKTPVYYPEFVGHVIGASSEAEYDDYFDQRVDLTEQLAGRLERMGARGETVYIWGEYPWVYALSGSRPATRYVTSFYVLLIPGLAEKLEATLLEEDPTFVVIMDDAWPQISDPGGVMRWRFDTATSQLNHLLATRYQKVADIEKAHVYRRALPPAQAFEP